MIWALLAILILGSLGGSSDTLIARLEVTAAQIETVVADESRRGAAQEALQGMIDARSAALEDLSSFGQKFEALLAAHQTPRIEFEGLFEQVATKRREHFERQLSARFALREKLTEEEWRQLFPPPSALASASN